MNQQVVDCIYKDTCPRYESDNEICNKCKTCPYYLIMQGERGSGGYWNSRNIPNKYDRLTVDNLFKGRSFDKMHEYISKMPTIVEAGTGLYLYSSPTNTNPLGTGTGKTTSACIILNEYVKLQGKLVAQKKAGFTKSLGLFVRMAEFQNKFNAQFRGTIQQREQFSSSYYMFKGLMQETNLLVLDDIATRTATESFLNEIFEIVDYRLNEDKCTIFTSNVPLDRLVNVFDERITSRIDGLTVPIPFTGDDKRKRVF